MEMTNMPHVVRNIFNDSIYSIALSMGLSLGCNKPNPIVSDIRRDVMATTTKHNKTESVHRNADKISLYLSFDDGPTWGSETVNEEAITDSINITVFVIGKFVLRSDDNLRLFGLYQQNPFIEIGNHSFTHANSHYHQYYRQSGTVLQDFLTNYDTLHLSHKIARLPGRNSWRVVGMKRNDLEDAGTSADTLASAGYDVFGWDIEWRYDSNGKIIETTEEMFNKIEIMSERKTSFMPGNIVILCHDPILADTSNLQSFRNFVRKIKLDGRYQFKPLSQYPVR